MVQTLEQTAREILTLLQGVHQGTGFQDSESRTATLSRWGTGSALRGARVPLSRVPLSQASCGCSRGVVRGLRGGCRGEEGAAGSSRAMRVEKMLLHPQGAPLFPFLPSLVSCVAVSVQKSVLFLEVFAFWAIALAPL